MLRPCLANTGTIALRTAARLANLFLKCGFTLSNFGFWISACAFASAPASSLIASLIVSILVNVGVGGFCAVVVDLSPRLWTHGPHQVNARAHGVVLTEHLGEAQRMVRFAELSYAICVHVQPSTRTGTQESRESRRCRRSASVRGSSRRQRLFRCHHLTHERPTGF